MVSKPKLIGCTPYVYSAGRIPGHITCIWNWPKIEGVPTFEGYLENNEGQISRINSKKQFFDHHPVTGMSSYV